MNRTKEKNGMRKLLAFAACGVFALGVAACGDDDDDSGGGGGGDLSRSIRIDGSSTVGPFAQAAAEEFQGQNPNVKVTVGTSGTGGGFEKFCAGETDISDASRPIEDDEAAICEKNGITYKEVQVANDGISVTTNKDMQVDCLTTDELKALRNKPQVKAFMDYVVQSYDSIAEASQIVPMNQQQAQKATSALGQS